MTGSWAPGAVCDGLTTDGTVPAGLLPLQPPDIGNSRRTMWDEAACALRGRPESVRLARAFARETLAIWGRSELCDDVTWVVSELVTNALKHGLPQSAGANWARPVRLCLALHPAHVLCSVSDPGDGAPVRKAPDYLGESGRGLHVVESCSDRWGCNPLDGGGKVIWAAFRVHR